MIIKREKIYTKKDGIHSNVIKRTSWWLFDIVTYGETIKNKIKRIEIYPFPTLKFNYIENNINRINTFDIQFIWMAWEIRITKYWDEAYMEQMEILKG